MAEQQTGRQVEVAAEGRVVGTADVNAVDATTVRADLRIASGHTPVGAGTRLVDAVLDAAAGTGSRLEATVAAGDSESLGRLRDRCEDVETRPAGATTLVDAVLPAAGALPASQR